MNVRFSEGSVRCRVTATELDVLLVSGTLVLAVPLPRQHRFQLTVRAAALGEWHLESDPTGLWVSIPRTEIAQLRQALPSREGIAHLFKLGDGQQVQVGFEVDVRKRPPAPSSAGAATSLSAG